MARHISEYLDARARAAASRVKRHLTDPARHAMRHAMRRARMARERFAKHGDRGVDSQGSRAAPVVPAATGAVATAGTGAPHDAHDTRHTRQRNAPAPNASRNARLLLGVVAGILIIGGILLCAYLLERNAAARPDLSSPSPAACSTMWFKANAALCEKTLSDAYAAVPPLRRGPICDIAGGERYRERFGSAALLCAAYDDALASGIYASTLAQRGVSVWEPVRDVTTQGSLKYRTLRPAASVSIVCDDRIIPASADGIPAVGGNGTLVVHEPVNGTCVIIAVSAEGSMTSMPFNLTVTATAH